MGQRDGEGITITTTSCSQGTLDVFAARDAVISYTTEELIDEQMKGNLYFDGMPKGEEGGGGGG